MGNGESHLHLEGNAKKKTERFNACELKVIKETFKNLSYLSSDQKNIDKVTFLQYFHLPGLIGERLFAAFDKRNEGCIPYDDFISALAVLCRGTWEEKVEFIFQVYDINGSNTISKRELSALINHVPKDVIGLYWDQRTVESRYQESYAKRKNFGGVLTNADAIERSGHGTCVSPNATTTIPLYGSAAVLHGEEKNCMVEINIEDAFESTNGPSSDKCNVQLDECINGIREYPYGFSNEEIVAQAFEECNLNGSGRLSLTEFKLWMERNPIMITYLQKFFPYDGNRETGDDRNLPFIHNQLFSTNFPNNFGKKPVFEGTTSPTASDHVNLPLLMGEGEDHTHKETRRLLLLIAKITSHTGIREEIPNLLEKLNGAYSAADAHKPPLLELENTFSSSCSASATSSTTRHSENPVAIPKPRRKRRERSPSEFNCSKDFTNGLNPGSHNNIQEKRSSSAIVNPGSAVLPLLRNSYIDGQRGLGNRKYHLTENHVVTKEGWLIKKGHRLRVLRSRWFVLLGNCIYYYVSKKKTHPKGVMFLLGSYVEPINLYDVERKGYWGFEISRLRNGKERSKLFYSNSQAERDSWVLHLRKACKAVPIEEDYHIGQVLGKGRFSHVCACVNKRTLERKAVKIINKALMDDEEKELVRSEIAIMKLIDHPNIVQMEDIYEGKYQIYIVMELYSGGELFDRIVGQSCFTEDQAYFIIHPLVEAVAYLHSMGIIHRDLKPENILCGNDMMDVKIADFGLSKLIYPDEVMKLPCGTLSYVAPEVLTLSGYGKEADIWSIGIIFYLLICGGLPFDGDTRKAIIAKTISAELDVDNPEWQCLSADCQSIVLEMLNKDVKPRLTAANILNHPWMVSHLENDNCLYKSVATELL